MRHLPSDADRVTYAAISLQNHSLDEALPVLEALPTSAARTEALGRWVDGMGDLGAETLDELMENLDLPENQREALRAKLPK